MRQKKDKRYAGKEERWRDKRDATGCTAQGRIYGWRDDGRGQETEREIKSLTGLVRPIRRQLRLEVRRMRDDRKRLHPHHRQRSLRLQEDEEGEDAES